MTSGSSVFILCKASCLLSSRSPKVLEASFLIGWFSALAFCTVIPEPSETCHRLGWSNPLSHPPKCPGWGLASHFHELRAHPHIAAFPAKISPGWVGPGFSLLQGNLVNPWPRLEGVNAYTLLGQRNTSFSKWLLKKQFCSPYMGSCLCVPVSVSHSEICFRKTRVEAAVDAALLEGAGPSSGLAGKLPPSAACRIYSRQTINQHQAINLAFEPSLKPIKAHSCQMEFILISFQSQ